MHLRKACEEDEKYQHMETHDVSRPKRKMQIVQSFWRSSSEAVFCACSREWLVKKVE